MICEQAEEHLSAYLDDMLEPSARAEIAAHLETCDACRAELADLRRLDGLLAAAPRIEPSDALHDRIFESAEFARLMRELDRSAGDRGAPNALPHHASPWHIAPPGWTGGAWRAAAVLVLVLGSALLIRQGLLHSGTPSGHDGQVSIGAPSRPAPLSAGARAVYEHGGALWSAPESAAGIAQRLTSAGIQVAGWAVSPDGHLVAYIDAHTGSIHLIRSDDQNDQTLAASAVVGKVSAAFWNSAAGHDVSQSIAWSPDGLRIAYLAGDASGDTTLHLMNADGSNDQALNASVTVHTGVPVWSADSLRLAYTQTTDGVQSVWSYSADTKSILELSAQADEADSGATVAGLAWLPDALHPTVTWSAQDGGVITGLFSRSILSSGPAQRLTPTAMRFSAADFSAARDGGTWLVAGASSSPAIATVSAQSGEMTVEGTGVTVSRVGWSPDGTSAYLLTQDGQLKLWAPGFSPVAALSGVSGTPAWSSDGSALAALANGRVVIVRIAGSAPAGLVQMGAAPQGATFVWSPDGSELAISAPSGITLASVDGTQTKLVDSRGADGGQIVWSIAG